MEFRICVYDLRFVVICVLFRLHGNKRDFCAIHTVSSFEIQIKKKIKRKIVIYNADKAVNDKNEKKKITKLSKVVFVDKW